MDCSPPGSSVHRILQARILEWVVTSSSRGSSRPRDWTCIFYVSCIGRQVLYHQRHLGSPGRKCQSWILNPGVCLWSPRSVTWCDQVTLAYSMAIMWAEGSSTRSWAPEGRHFTTPGPSKFLWMCWRGCAQSCLTLCDLMGCSPSGPSLCGILQARILEWVAISSSRGSSRTRDQTRISYRRTLPLLSQLGSPQIC